MAYRRHENGLRNGSTKEWDPMATLVLQEWACRNRMDTHLAHLNRTCHLYFLIGGVIRHHRGWTSELWVPCLHINQSLGRTECLLLR